MHSQFPLTNFIMAMQAATTEQLMSCNPEKMAAKYGCRVNDVKDQLRVELNFRGKKREGLEINT